MVASIKPSKFLEERAIKGIAVSATATSSGCVFKVSGDEWVEVKVVGVMTRLRVHLGASLVSVGTGLHLASAESSA